LKAVEEFHPHVILCDIGLPGMDGYQFMRILRKRPSMHSVRAVAMSGYGRAEDVRLAYNSGFDLHLTKPLDYNYLCSVFADLLATPGKKNVRYG
jgi:CheY-like chemotaxis protein